MARLVQASRRAALLLHSSSSSLKTHLLKPPKIKNSISNSLTQTRNYISEMRKSAFEGNILRILRNEIQYETEYAPPQQPVREFNSFVVEDQAGEQWITLRRKFGDNEEIKIEVTMFDGSVPAKSEDGEDFKLHISLIVDVLKGKGNEVFEFVCSAWPDSLEIQKVFLLKRNEKIKSPYVGPDFKELDDELQNSLMEFLEERGVNDELAGFLHEYMMNKDKTEMIRWMGDVKAFIEK